MVHSGHLIWRDTEYYNLIHENVSKFFVKITLGIMHLKIPTENFDYVYRKKTTDTVSNRIGVINNGKKHVNEKKTETTRQTRCLRRFVWTYRSSDDRIGVECASEKRGAMRVLWESNGKSQQEISRRTRKKV